MTANSDNGLQLSVDRWIAASPKTTWHIMTERLTEWWCPKPWSTEIVEQDWRAGGRSALVMHGPNGEEHPQEGIFLEVISGVRFVSTDALVRLADGSFQPSSPFMVGIWEIVAEGDGTRYTASARHWDEAATRRHEEMGFTDGWGTCADQLKALAEAEQAA